MRLPTLSIVRYELDYVPNNHSSIEYFYNSYFRRFAGSDKTKIVYDWLISLSEYQLGSLRLMYLPSYNDRSDLIYSFTGTSHSAIIVEKFTGPGMPTIYTAVWETSIE